MLSGEIAPRNNHYYYYYYTLLAFVVHGTRLYVGNRNAVLASILLGCWYGYATLLYFLLHVNLCMLCMSLCFIATIVVFFSVIYHDST